MNQYLDVLQGSNFGPSLYNLYASKLLDLITSFLMTSYADDTSLLFSFYPDNLHAAADAVDADLVKI